MAKKKLTPPANIRLNPVRMVVTFNNGDTTLHKMSVWNDEGQCIINEMPIEHGGIAKDIDVPLLPLLELKGEEMTPGKIIVKIMSVTREPDREDDSEPAQEEFQINEFHAASANLRLHIGRLENDYGENLKNLPEQITNAVKGILSGAAQSLEGLKNPDVAKTKDVSDLKEAINGLVRALDSANTNNTRNLTNQYADITTALKKIELLAQAAAQQAATGANAPASATGNNPTQTVVKFPILGICLFVVLLVLVAQAGSWIQTWLLVAHGMDLGCWRPCAEAAPVCTYTMANCAPVPKPSETCPSYAYVPKEMADTRGHAGLEEVTQTCRRNGCLPPQEPAKDVTKVTWMDPDPIQPGEQAAYAIRQSPTDVRKWNVRAYYDTNCIRYQSLGPEPGVSSDGKLTVTGFTATGLQTTNNGCRVLWFVTTR